MSAQIEWQEPDPLRPHEFIGLATDRRRYYVYDHGDGVYLATVRIRRGDVATESVQIGTAVGLDKAKALCQAEFDDLKF
jgi:hypothetical protein